MKQLVNEMQEIVPVDTGFLRASLEASTAGTPPMTRPNPDPNGSFSWNPGQVYAVIESATYGERVYLGYTAEYAALVHYGAGSRPARPWVDLVAQRWRQIVAEARARVVAGADV